MKGYGLFAVSVTPVTVFSPRLVAFVTQSGKDLSAHPQLGNVYAWPSVFGADLIMILFNALQ